MTGHRPPLTAVRAFEAAARHASFSRAAEELAVTHSAVSRQIKTLEDYLGITLFERTHRKVVLTAAGEHCASRISACLDGIAATFETLRPLATSQPLRLAVDADLAQLWLRPRLREFWEQNPDIQVDLFAQSDLTVLPDSADCAIAWLPSGSGPWETCRYELLYLNWAFPIVSPDLISARPGLTKPEALAGHRLIHDRSRQWWEMIAARLPRGSLDWQQGTIFTQTALCLDAAADGDGLTLGDEISTQKYLADGRFIVPFKVRVPSTEPYFLLYRDNGLMDARILALRHWLQRQMRAHRAWFDAFWADLPEPDYEAG